MAKLKAGDKCPECEFEMVEITRDTYKQIMDVMKPRIYSIPNSIQKSESATLPICPKCDAYSLGIDSLEGFPFKDKEGNEKTIHDIKDGLWV